MRRGKTGLFLSCGGTFGIPLQWRWVFRGSSWVASRVSRTLLRLKREGGISLETLQWKRASFYVEGRISWFFSSCSRKFRLSLELRPGPQGPARVASGKSSLHVSCEGPLGIPLQSVQGPRASSPHWGQNLTIPLQCWHGSLGSYVVSRRESGCISCGDMELHFPLEV